uniref:C2H2-type domain-containing protein n=1 Tax=Globodera rostochiensis TaxID=31243 RepID=A0A914GTR5_GLORO
MVRRSLTDADAVTSPGTVDKKRSRRESDTLNKEEPARPKDFSFDEWRERYLVWNKKRSLSGLFRRIDKFDSGMVPRKLFIDEIVASKFSTTELEMARVADEFDNGDGLVNSREFMNALRFVPHKMLHSTSRQCVQQRHGDRVEPLGHNVNADRVAHDMRAEDEENLTSAATLESDLTEEFVQIYPTLAELMKKANEAEKQPQHFQQVQQQMLQQQSHFGGYGRPQMKSYAAAAATCGQQIQGLPGGQTAQPHQHFQQVQQQMLQQQSHFGGYGRPHSSRTLAGLPGGQTAQPHQHFQQVQQQMFIAGQQQQRMQKPHPGQYRPPRYVRPPPPQFPCQLSNCDKVCKTKSGLNSHYTWHNKYYRKKPFNKSFK